MDFSTEFIVPEITKSLRTRNRSMKTCRFSLFWYLRITQTKLYYKYISEQQQRKRVLVRRKCYLSFFRPITNRKLKDFLWFH